MKLYLSIKTCVIENKVKTSAVELVSECGDKFYAEIAEYDDRDFFTDYGVQCLERITFETHHREVNSNFPSINKVRGKMYHISYIIDNPKTCIHEYAWNRKEGKRMLARGSEIYIRYLLKEWVSNFGLDEIQLICKVVKYND